jgi:hypothetical protein
MKLAEESFLTDDFLRQLINVGEVDILVGLPTHNNAKTIGPIVHTIQSGILRGFPRERAVIVNVDGGSRDGTPELVTGVSIDDLHPASNLYALRTLPSISTKYASSPASGVAFRTILAAAELLRAKACVVMSPESVNIEPEWLAKLLRPIYGDGFDLVTPTYRRHKFEGLLITNLLYPMTRALYGLRIREAYSPEFGFSGRLGSQFLGQNIWNDGTDGAGVELRFTLAAIAGRYRVCQSFLGEKITSSAMPLIWCRRCDKLSVPCSPHWSQTFPSGVPWPVPSRPLRPGQTMKCFWNHCESIGNDCERCSRPELPNWSPSFSQFFPPPPWQNYSASPTWGKRSFITLQNCGSGRFTSLPPRIGNL